MAQPDIATTTARPITPRSCSTPTATMLRRCVRNIHLRPSPSSFRDGPKDQPTDAQLRIGESRDSGFDAAHRPGMTPRRNSMASIHKDVPLPAPAADVWDAVRDFGALHRRLVPGFVLETRLDGEARIVSFA